MFFTRALTCLTFLLSATAATVTHANTPFQDLKSIRHSAVVQAVTFKQIAPISGPRIMSNPTVIELEVGISGGCQDLAVDQSEENRVRFVQIGSMGPSAMPGCFHKAQYYWAPGDIFAMEINESKTMSLEIGPNKRYDSAGKTIEEWFTVEAKVTRRFGVFDGGRGNYFEYADVKILAPKAP